MSATTLSNENKATYRDGLKFLFNPSSLLTGATIFLGSLALLPACDTTTAAQAAPDPIVIAPPAATPL